MYHTEIVFNSKMTSKKTQYLSNIKTICWMYKRFFIVGFRPTGVAIVDTIVLISIF